MSHDSPAVDEAELDELDAPQQGETRVRVDEDETGQLSDDEIVTQTTPEEAITELTDEERAQFRELLTIGRRSKTFTLFEHEITVCTLNSDDEIRVFRACRSDEDTAAYPRSYQTAFVAAALRMIDGKPLDNTLIENPDADTVFEQKLTRVRQYYALVIQAIYKETLDAEREFVELARKLGKL